MAEKININTIAKRAKVSTTTVSNFINCTETIPISKEKQSRILGIMQESNYRANSSSSLMRRKKQLPCKGVFVYGNYTEAPPFTIIPNPMLSQLLIQLSNAFMERFGIGLEVRSVLNEESRDEWNEVLIDAEFIVNYGRLNPVLFTLTKRKNIPFIVISEDDRMFLDKRLDETTGADFVYWDSRKHPEILLEHLCQKGARKTFFISSWNVSANREKFFAVEAEEKIEGYREYLASHPEMSGEVITPPMPENVNMFYEIRNVYDLLRKKPEILEKADAILAHNDVVAQGVIAAMRERGMVPGKDVLLTGEGDFAEYRYSIPAVTTITYDSGMLTRQVCGLLDKKLAESRYYGEKLLIPSHIIQRETT